MGLQEIAQFLRKKIAKLSKVSGYWNWASCVQYMLDGHDCVHVVGMFPSHQRNPCLSAHCQYVMDRGARLNLTSALMKQSLMSSSGCCALTATIFRLSSESNSPLASTITPLGNTKSGVYTAEIV